MKKLGVLVILFVLCRIGYDQYMRSMAQRNARKVDEQMARIADELNAKMPVAGPLVKITKVEYAQHVLRFSGMVTAQALSAETKAGFSTSARSEYCSGKFVQAKVGVDYEVLGPPHDINDLTRESWVLSLRPESC
jgi:hypothetical protein